MSTTDEMYDGNSYMNDTSPGPWMKEYALFPKKVKGSWVWFDTYYWRAVWIEYSPGVGTYNEWRKEYGTIFDVLETEE